MRNEGVGHGLQGLECSEEGDVTDRDSDGTEGGLDPTSFLERVVQGFGLLWLALLVFLAGLGVWAITQMEPACSEFPRGSSARAECLYDGPARYR